MEIESLVSEVLATIKPKDELYKTIDSMAIITKEIYNVALSISIEHYKESGNVYNYYSLYSAFRENNLDLYRKLQARTSNGVIKGVATNMIAFAHQVDDFQLHPSKYSGEPGLPKPLGKDARYPIEFTCYQVYYRDGKIHFPKSTGIPPIKTRIQFENLNTYDRRDISSPLRLVRIVPKYKEYKIELVYRKVFNIPENNFKNIAAIDLGIDNFATVVVWGNKNARPLIINGKGIKSYNKNFNSRIAKMKSNVMKYNNASTSDAIKRLYDKRNNKYKHFYHEVSKRIVEYLIENEVKYLIIGRRQGWKQRPKLGRNINQTFSEIAHYQFILKLEYKAREAGIEVYEVSEEFTSGTSYIDGETATKENYERSRRVSRGLFLTNAGIKVNADVNAAYQILNKACGYKLKFDPRVMGKSNFIPFVYNSDTFKE